MQVTVFWDVMSCDCNVIFKSLKVITTADTGACTTALNTSYFCASFIPFSEIGQVMRSVNGARG